MLKLNNEFSLFASKIGRVEFRAQYIFTVIFSFKNLHYYHEQKKIKIFRKKWIFFVSKTIFHGNII